MEMEASFDGLLTPLIHWKIHNSFLLSSLLELFFHCATLTTFSCKSLTDFFFQLIQSTRRREPEVALDFAFDRHEGKEFTAVIRKIHRHFRFHFRGNCARVVSLTAVWGKRLRGQATLGREWNSCLFLTSRFLSGLQTKLTPLSSTEAS